MQIGKLRPKGNCYPNEQTRPADNECKIDLAEGWKLEQQKWFLERVGCGEIYDDDRMIGGVRSHPKQGSPYAAIP